VIRSYGDSVLMVDGCCVGVKVRIVSELLPTQHAFTSAPLLEWDEANTSMLVAKSTCIHSVGKTQYHLHIFYPDASF